MTHGESWLHGETSQSFILHSSGPTPLHEELRTPPHRRSCLREGFKALHLGMGQLGCAQVGVGIWGAPKRFSSSFSEGVRTGVKTGSWEHLDTQETMK